MFGRGLGQQFVFSLDEFHEEAEALTVAQEACLLGWL